MARAYFVFHSTHDTMKAESAVQKAGVTGKVVMKPAGIRIDCGLALRTDETAQADAAAALANAGIKVRGVYVL